MPVEISRAPLPDARPVYLVSPGKLGATDLPADARDWAAASGYAAESGRLMLYPTASGELGGAVLAVPDGDSGYTPLSAGSLARSLPAGDWRFAAPPSRPELAALALAIGGYEFTAYRRASGKAIRFDMGPDVDVDRAMLLAEGVELARNLVNTPANDMGPEALEAAVKAVAKRFRAKVKVVRGGDLLKRNFPLIHAVGRAAEQEPRLIDLQWGPKNAPKVTLVGKGVCFDTGGLDIKTSAGMLLMKKDMGGAANALALAQMLMAGNLPIRLRLLIPAVENSISASSFRPGDVLPSRKGLTVEIGNTDAEGRLVLADALALADEEEPDLLIDLATLTGAARIALGPDLPPFYTDDEALAGAVSEQAMAVADPVWRMPLWNPYDAKLSSKIADLNNVTSDGLAGSVTAALFLRRFVERAKSWAHFDVFAWNPSEKPHAPVGGEAQAIRALERVIAARYG